MVKKCRHYLSIWLLFYLFSCFQTGN